MEQREGRNTCSTSARGSRKEIHQNPSAYEVSRVSGSDQHCSENRHFNAACHGAGFSTHLPSRTSILGDSLGASISCGRPIVHMCRFVVRRSLSIAQLALVVNAQAFPSRECSMPHAFSAQDMECRFRPSGEHTSFNAASPGRDTNPVHHIWAPTQEPCTLFGNAVSNLGADPECRQPRA